MRSPEVATLSEVGVSLSAADIAWLAWQIAHEAKMTMQKHNSSTARDGRLYSRLHKTEGILDMTESIAVSGFIGKVTEEIYAGTLEWTQQFVPDHLERMVGQYAAVGHAYFANSDDGEGHVDYTPSAIVYLEVPSDGGRLVVARNQNAATIDEIKSDSVTIKPEPGLVVFPYGTEYPHFVEGIPAAATGYRASLNLSFWSLPANPDPAHPRHRS